MSECNRPRVRGLSARIRRPRFERLEARRLLAVFAVTDFGDGSNGETLRLAIGRSNATPGPDTIVFTGPATFSPASPIVIRPLSPLPTITDPVTVDGTTAPGFAGTPRVEIDGSLAGPGADGLSVASTGVTIDALSIYAFADAGIEILGPGGDVVRESYVGVDPSGTTPRPNGVGIRISASADNTIGAASAGAGNVVSGNAGPGIHLVGATTARTVVSNNFVGTNPAGAAPVPNSGDGILVEGAPNSTIGGQLGSGNVVSGNAGAGVRVTGLGARGSFVSSNLIGLDATGKAPLGNAGDGVAVEEAPGIIVGGDTSLRNVISANGGRGVSVRGAGAIGGGVSSNYIGTDITGSLGSGSLGNGSSGVFVGRSPTSGAPSGTLIGGPIQSFTNFIGNNGLHGIEVSGASGVVIQFNQIGFGMTGVTLGNAGDGIRLDRGTTGTTIDFINSIGSNGGDGIHMSGAGTSGNIVALGLIGTDLFNLNRGNLGNGVRIDAGATGNTIGSFNVSQRNTIANNGANGVLIAPGSTGNLVLNNNIGTNRGGSEARPNFGDGVRIEADGNTIGDPNFAALFNLISGNAGAGIHVTGRASASNNGIFGNRIGTRFGGFTPLGNAGPGVSIDGEDAFGTRVGGPGGAGNLISGNGGHGVSIFGSATGSNRVEGNRIGTAINGFGSIPNGGNGVMLDGSNNNTVGGDSAPLGNFISGNRVHGVHDNNGRFNVIAANVIGLDAAGTGRLGNGGNGILLHGAEDALGIAKAGNIIAANALDGVAILDSFGSEITGNTIGTNPAGATGLGNDRTGVNLTSVSFVTGRSNVVSGNGLFGIYASTGVGLVMSDNVIGLAAGDRPVPNGEAGIFFEGVSRSLIGMGTSVFTPTSGGGNVVRSNLGAGVILRDSSGNTVDGNSIRDNANDGIYLFDSAGNDFRSNEVGANAGNGVTIVGAGSSGNRVSNNAIGTDFPGTTKLPNSGHGILIDGAPGNVIGGPQVSGNFISANRLGGILVRGAGATGTLIASNTLGQFRVPSFPPAPNGGSAISVIGAGRVTIGGDAGTGNTIISGDLDGITVESAPATIVGNLVGSVLEGRGGLARLIGRHGIFLITSDTQVRDNRITGFREHGIAASVGSQRLVLTGNRIGGAPGSQPLSRGGGGIIFNGVTDSTIGSPDAPNVVENTDRIGITIGASSSIRVVGNVIGASPSFPGSGNGSHGLFVVNTTASLFRGNTITANGGDGIRIIRNPGRPSPDGNRVEGNVIGADAGGRTAFLPNGGYGILIERSSGNTIGGSFGNDIGANALGGIALRDGAGSILIAGNLIGRYAGGPGSGGDGILIDGSDGVTVGGLAAGLGNVVAANRRAGVVVRNGAGGAQILGNLIGLGPDGSTPAPNGADGLLVASSAGVTVSDNTISANGGHGVRVFKSRAVTVVANRVGTDGSGTSARGNGLSGVILVDATDSRVGTGEAGGRNVLSGNAEDGVAVVGAGSAGVAVRGNFVGLDAGGRPGLGNGEGVLVDGASGTSVEGNAIGSNRGVGIAVAGGAAGVVLVSNLVGLAADGTGRVAPNGTDGVFVDNSPGVILVDNTVSGNASVGVQVFGSGSIGAILRANRIGTEPGGREARGNGLVGVFLNGAPGAVVEGNVIAANASVNVQIVGPGASGNRVAGNLIGLDATGRAVLGTQAVGILLQAPGNTVGGTTDAARNLIAGGTSVGIQVAAPDASGNLIAGNWVGLDASGTRALGNGVVGILIDGAGGNTIGGNVVTGSGSVDLILAGPGSTGNVVAGNRVGTDATGSAGLAGAPIGLFLNGAPSNTVGGPAAGAGNLIAGHGQVGLQLFAAGATRNLVVGNRIGPGPGGARSLANRLGVFLNGAPNNTIGGAVGPANLIVGNARDPILVAGRGATGNQVGGNLIGRGGATALVLPAGPRRAARRVVGTR